MEFNGLPLHILVIHAAVVFGPLAAAAAVVYAVVGRWRELVRWPLIAVVLIATGSVWLAYYSGVDFRGTERFATAEGEFADRLQRHQDLGGLLRWVVTAFALVTLGAAGWLHRREGAVRVVASVAVVVLAVATGVLTGMTGEAGSRAVWGQ